MSPSERTVYLARKRINSERAAKLAPPPLTGDTGHDLAAFEDKIAEVETLWSQVDEQARYARSELGSWPGNQAVADADALAADVEMIWAARQELRATREQLSERFFGRGYADDVRDQERFFDAIDARDRTMHQRPGWSER